MGTWTPGWVGKKELIHVRRILAHKASIRLSDANNAFITRLLIMIYSSERAINAPRSVLRVMNDADTISRVHPLHMWSWFKANHHPETSCPLMQCAYFLEGGSLSLRRRLGPHLQLLAQHRQLLHRCHHRRLFLTNQLEQREKRSRWCLSG